MEAKPLLRIQLPTTGPSSVFLQEDMKVLVRQGDYLMVVNLQSRSIEQKIPMPTYTGQPGTCVENFYYEVDSASLTKTNFVDIDQKKYNLDTHLNAQAFLAYDRVILTVSDGDLYCVYPDTLEVTFISKFVPATAVFQHNLNELGAVYDGKLHVCNMESHEVTSTETALQNFLIRCGESDYIQVADKISYKGESHGQASCMRSQPFVNDQFVIIVDEAGQFEIIQTALLQNAQPYTATIKFNRSVFTPGEKKTQKKEYTVQDKLNDLVQQINILKSQTMSNAQIDVNSALKTIMSNATAQDQGEKQELQNLKNMLKVAQDSEIAQQLHISSLSSELAQKTEQIKQLKENYEQSLQQQQNQLQKQVDSELQIQIVSLQQQQFQLQHENDLLKQKVRDFEDDSRIHAQEMKIKQTQHENETSDLKAQIAHLKNALDEITKTKPVENSSPQRTEMIAEKLQQMNKNQADLQQEISFKNNEIRRLEALVQNQSYKHQEEFQNITQTLTELKDSQQKLQKQVALTTEIKKPIQLPSNGKTISMQDRIAMFSKK
ncbi:Conserved_hypothetical protein [Hexamita inflata]|uniref:Uncharacterized protein n=1 Tax=Hexamita inflata TaxID=28002 RepID=A0ABP1HWC2_9EUKA